MKPEANDSRSRAVPPNIAEQPILSQEPIAAASDQQDGDDSQIDPEGKRANGGGTSHSAASEVRMDGSSIESNCQLCFHA